MLELERKLKYEFTDKSILATALTHSSYANEKRDVGCVSNERLEFLGDSILGMTVAHHLYESYSNMPEGKMTRLRAELVCEQSLYTVATKLDLGSFMRLGKGEANSGGRKRSSILADAVEAVIAALYLDGGYENAREFIAEYILPFADVSWEAHISDYKTALQELIQQHSGSVLSYHLLGESGPDHDKRFEAEVRLNDNPLGSGSGRTKKEAEQSAAKRALEELQK